MSNTKHLADMLKVCSILPVFAVMPAMAETSVSGVQVFDTGVSDVDASTTKFGGLDSVYFVTIGSDLTVKSGAEFKNNKADLGVFSTTKNKPMSALHLEQGVLFEGNVSRFDGGAVANFGILSSDGAIFRNNKAQIDLANNDTPMGGGAIALGAESLTVIENSIFEGNESMYHGGAIAMRAPADGDNSAADLDIIGSNFTSNSAVKNGGAIYSTFYDSVNEKDSVYIEDTYFSSNNAVNGGAIYNDGDADRKYNKASMKILKGYFDGNIASSEGGAVYNKGSMIVSESEFMSNKVLDGFGGAVKNNGTLTVNDTNFSENIAYVGGAVATSSKTGLTNIVGGRFDENHALADGGALGVYLDAMVTGTWFVDNSAGLNKKIDGVMYEAASDANGGGALFVGQKGKVTLNDVHFVDNETGVSGGAIHARHFLSDGAYLKMNTVEFDDNDAKKNGGAIASIYDGVIDVDNGTFTSNTAGQNGGAIYVGVDMNYGSSDGTGSESTDHGTINFSGLNRFEGNIAGVAGGAIYNDAGGTVNFGGTTVFKDNKVGKYAGLNDIHNLGTVNILNGATVTMNGGVTGNTGTFNLAEGAVLNMGSSTISQSSIVLNGTVFADVLTDGSAQYVDRADKAENMRENNSGTYAKLLGNVSGSGSINLNVGSVGTYKMFDHATDITINAGKAYDVDVINGTDVKVSLKSVETLAGDTGLSQRAAGAISSLASSGSRSIQMVSLAAQKLLNSEDPDAIAKIEQETAKLNPEDKPVTQSVSTSLNNQVLSLTAGRMSGGAATMAGRSGGDALTQESGFWMQGLYNKSKSGSAFDGTTRGFALGTDTLIDNKYTLGAGFAYNNTNLTSGTRDTEIDSQTLFIYGQYKPNKWFANATLAYTMSEYTENTDPFGIAVESTYDVDAFGAQLMTGYDFATGITPEMGLRYLHITQDAYDNGVNEIAEQNTDFLTAVAGLKYAFYVETENMLKFRPELRAALTYDVVNDDSHATVMLPSIGASYNVDGKALNKIGGEFGIGLTAEYKGMEFSVMYDLDVHEDYTSQTGMIKFRGQF